VWQNSGSVLDKEKNITVKDGKFAQAAENYKEFFITSAAPARDPGHDLKWAFREGIYSMFISGPWMVDIINREIPELKGKWGVSVLPAKDTRTSFVGGCHLVMFENSPNKDEAWKFIEFMSGPGIQNEWFDIAGGLPANRLSWKSGFFEDRPLIKVFGDQMNDTKSPPNIPEWEEMASAIKQRVEEYILDEVSVRGMQELLYNDLQKILRREDTGSKNVLAWFLGIIVCGGILLILYIAKLGPKENQMVPGLKQEISVGKEVPGGMPVRGIRKNMIPWLFIFPAVITLAVFLFFPIFSSFLISLTNWNIYTFSDLSRLRFLGFGNYIALFRDRVFWQALLNTVIFSGVGIPLNITIALLLAVLIDKKYIKTKAVFRGGYFMPVVTTLVAVAVVWKWMYNYEFGLANYFIGLLRIERQNWLNNQYLALPSLIVMSVWKNFGYNMVIILAGLQTIPRSLYESASVDGADGWQSFWHITFPSLKPTLFFVMIMTTIGSFQFFAEPYVMTDGGPLNRTLSIVLHMYREGFKFFKFGYGTAIAYTLFLCILAFTLIQLWYRKRLEAK
jgi:multiple sugar transport system permease protein